MRKMLARKRATYARQSWKLFTLAGKEDASKEMPYKKKRSLPRCHGNGRACPGQLALLDQRVAWRREEREPEQSCGQDIGAFVLPQEYGIDSREDTGSLPTNGSCATDATADGAVAQRACPSASSMMDRLALPRDIGVWQWKRTGLFGLDLGLRTWTPAPRPGTPMPLQPMLRNKQVYRSWSGGRAFWIHEPERPVTKYERV